MRNKSDVTNPPVICGMASLETCLEVAPEHHDELTEILRQSDGQPHVVGEWVVTSIIA